MGLTSSLKRINRDSIPHFTRIALQQSRQKFDTALSYILSTWWRVKLGKKCTFVGAPRFRRAPSGLIEIGDRCRFLSKSDANQHGLNRPCMLSVLSYGAQIQIGDDVGMSGTVIAAATKVSIGSRVMCGANTTITDTDSHSLNYTHRHPAFYGIDTENFSEPVSTDGIAIGDDVFLGMNVIVLKGVTIGQGTVVGAGSIVAKSLPAGVIAVGQPAKPVANLSDYFPELMDG
ncbi:MAG: hypothetical protein DRR42_08845 [Gammaproteobacteria bacterium]|nr:MAG: hypothetical protein DRR42_08845 [Gammaproteobacteria bacterium]